MQKKTTKRILCLLLTLLSIFPLLVSTGMFSVSAATSYKVIATSNDDSIQYVGKNYKTGASNSTQTFALNSGFLLQNGSTTYWGTCIRGGYKDPPVGVYFSSLKEMTINLVDGLNQKDEQGSHYIVSAVSGGNDSTAGRSRNVDSKFAFLCYYYANQYLSTEFSALSSEDCSIQEAVAIAYRYEWDTRLIKYGNTGSWDNASKTWTINPVSNWREDTTHFSCVSDGNSKHTAIVNAANAILKYAMNDPDGIKSKIQTSSDGMGYSYTDSNGGKHIMVYAEGTARQDDPSKVYQDLLLYNAPAPILSYKLRVIKNDENGHLLPGATFALYKKNGSTYAFVESKAAPLGYAVWYDLEAGDYYVTETAAPSGYVLDSTKHYVTLGGADASETVNIEIVNQVATVTWAPDVNKRLTGRSLAAGEFSFQLSENGSVLQTVKNTADGNIPFAEITYTISDVGTHVYIISEIAGTDQSITYDSHAVTYTVTVTNTASGLIVSDSVSGNRTFTNTYTPPTGSWTPQVEKKLTGRDLHSGEFTFELLENNRVIQSVTNKANGSILFASINYALADVGTHRYVIRELTKTGSDVAYDGHEIEYIVTVSYQAGGKSLTISESVSGDTTFRNYAPSAIWTPQATKELVGRDLKDSEFTFELLENNRVIQTVTNKANGTIPFASIKYDLSDVGTHVYIIREISSQNSGSDGTVSYDGHSVTYTVEVSCCGTGTELEIQENVSGRTTFTNFVPKGSWTPKVNKILDGRELTAGEFTFELLDEEGHVLQTVRSQENGSIPFEPILFDLTEIGRYVFSIREKPGDDETVSFDSHTITYMITVSYSGTGAELTVKEIVSGNETFTNYVPLGKWMPEVTKELNGRELRENEFTFELLDSEGSVLQQVTNLADGSIPFAALFFDLTDIGTHLFTIREVNGGDASVVYDEHTISYSVTVTYSGAGTVLTVAEVRTGSAVFWNDVPTAEWKPEVYKELHGRELQEDEFTFVLKGENGDILQTVTNLADGTIPFETILYTAADIGKTYVYEISEVIGNDPAIRYDTHTVTFTVCITYDLVGDSLQENTIVRPMMRVVSNKPNLEGTGFTNEIPVGSWKLEISKKLHGRELQEGEFAFELLDLDGNLLQVVKNDADGTVPFAVIVYGLDDVGTHIYLIRETIADETGMLYDEHIIKVAVTVSYVGFGTELTIEEHITGSTSFDNYIPSIGTAASIDGGKFAKANGTLTIEDEVSYENLMPGKEYTIYGVLMDKATSNPFLLGGKEITASVTFTPENASGTVTVSFTFDASIITENTELVIFETMLLDGIELIAHADLSDDGQTVTLVPPPPTPETGDGNQLLLWAALAAVSFGVLLLLLKRRNAHRRSL